jgi:hypothetical protein
MELINHKNVEMYAITQRTSSKVTFYPLANEVAKGYSNATFRNILVNTLESTSFNGF